MLRCPLLVSTPTVHFKTKTKTKTKLIKDHTCAIFLKCWGFIISASSSIIKHHQRINRPDQTRPDQDREGFNLADLILELTFLLLLGLSMDILSRTKSIFAHFPFFSARSDVTNWCHKDLQCKLKLYIVIHLSVPIRNKYETDFNMTQT